MATSTSIYDEAEARRLATEKGHALGQVWESRSGLSRVESRCQRLRCTRCYSYIVRSRYGKKWTHWGPIIDNGEECSGS